MKLITETHVIELTKRFAEVREQAKEIEALQKAMRDELMAALGDENSAMIGEYLIILSNRMRTDLDKDALAIKLGNELKKYQKHSTYQVLEVKKA